MDPNNSERPSAISSSSSGGNERHLPASPIPTPHHRNSRMPRLIRTITTSDFSSARSPVPAPGRTISLAAYTSSYPAIPSSSSSSSSSSSPSSSTPSPSASSAFATRATTDTASSSASTMAAGRNEQGYYHPNRSLSSNFIEAGNSRAFAGGSEREEQHEEQRQEEEEESMSIELIDGFPPGVGNAARDREAGLSVNYVHPSYSTSVSAEMEMSMETSTNPGSSDENETTDATDVAGPGSPLPLNLPLPSATAGSTIRTPMRMPTRILTTETLMTGNTSMSMSVSMAVEDTFDSFVAQRASRTAASDALLFAPVSASASESGDSGVDVEGSDGGDGDREQDGEVVEEEEEERRMWRIESDQDLDDERVDEEDGEDEEEVEGEREDEEEGVTDEEEQEEDEEEEEEEEEEEHSSSDELDDTNFGQKMERRIGLRPSSSDEGTTEGDRQGKKRKRTGWIGELEARTLRRGPHDLVLPHADKNKKRSRINKNAEEISDENLTAVVDYHLSSTAFIYTPTSGGYYPSTAFRQASLIPHLGPSLRFELGNPFSIRVLPDSWCYIGGRRVSGPNARSGPNGTHPDNSRFDDDLQEDDLLDFSFEQEGLVDSTTAMNGIAASAIAGVGVGVGGISLRSGMGMMGHRPLEGDFDRLVVHEREMARDQLSEASGSNTMRRESVGGRGSGSRRRTVSIMDLEMR